MATNTANHENQLYLVRKRKKIAIINIGAPAGGMNSAVYAMYCMSSWSHPICYPQWVCWFIKTRVSETD